MTVAPFGFGAPENAAAARRVNCHGKRWRTVSGRQAGLRSGSGNRRAGSSRGRDVELATDLHTDYSTQGVAELHKPFYRNVVIQRAGNCVFAGAQGPIYRKISLGPRSAG